MGFLDKLSSGASAASGIVGAVGGLASLISGNSSQKSMARYQQKLQMQLNEQQQQFARENAATDYDRQRALVRDNASLEKAGRQAAGLSTAGDFGSGSASVSPISAPTAGSAPTMPDPNASMLAGIQAIQASANNLVQNRSVALANEHQELENKALRDALPEYTKGIIGAGKSSAAKGDVDSASVEADKNKRHDESVITNNDLWKSENESAYASANAFSTALQLNQNALQAKELLDKAKADKTMSQENLRLFQDTYDYAVQAAEQNVINLKKQGLAIDASAEDSRSHAAVNKATAENVKADTQNRRDQHQLFEGSYSDQLRRIKLDSLPKNLYDKIQLWRSDGTFEKLDAFQQLGYGIYEAMSQSGIKLSDALSILKLLKR